MGWDLIHRKPLPSSVGKFTHMKETSEYVLSWLLSFCHQNRLKGVNPYLVRRRLED